MNSSRAIKSLLCVLALLNCPLGLLACDPPAGPEMQLIGVHDLAGKNCLYMADMVPLRGDKGGALFKFLEEDDRGVLTPSPIEQKIATVVDKSVQVSRGVALPPTSEGIQTNVTGDYVSSPDGRYSLIYYPRPHRNPQIDQDAVVFDDVNQQVVTQFTVPTIFYHKNGDSRKVRKSFHWVGDRKLACVHTDFNRTDPKIVVDFHDGDFDSDPPQPILPDWTKTTHEFHLELQNAYDVLDCKYDSKSESFLVLGFIGNTALPSWPQEWKGTLVVWRMELKTGKVSTLYIGDETFVPYAASVYHKSDIIYICTSWYDLNMIGKGWKELLERKDDPPDVLRDITVISMLTGESQSRSFQSDTVTGSALFLDDLNLLLLNSVGGVISPVDLKEEPSVRKFNLPKSQLVKSKQTVINWLLVNPLDLTVVSKWSAEDLLIPVCYEPTTKHLAVVNCTDTLESDRDYRSKLLFFRLIAQ